MMMRPVSSSMLRSANLFGRRLGQSKISNVAKVSGIRFLSESPWAKYEMAPLDPIIGLNEEFAKDDFPQKVIVGVGAYRDDRGKPYILPCVREAEDQLFKAHLDMEYSGIVSSTYQKKHGWFFIAYLHVNYLNHGSSFSPSSSHNLFLWQWKFKAGDAKFLEEALKFGYGKDSAALKDGRIQGVQALSGTGGLRVMGELLAKHGHKEIYVPNPTWGNHKAIFTVGRFQIFRPILLSHW